jgi:hypothetical protein
MAVKARQVSTVGDFDFDMMHCAGRNEASLRITRGLAMRAVFRRFFRGAGAFNGSAHCGVHVIPAMNYGHDCLLVAQPPTGAAR